MWSNFAQLRVYALTPIHQSTITSQGGTPITSCKFDFSSVLTDVKTMAATARLVENVGVSAYLGAAPLVDDLQLLGAAASILTVEARHQTMLNILGGGSSISNAFDMALSPSQVLAIAGGFISGCDLGVPANPALGVSNTGAITTGTKLELTSAAITGDTAVRFEYVPFPPPLCLIRLFLEPHLSNARRRR